MQIRIGENILREVVVKMKKVIMYKWNAVRSGRWGWSLKEVWNDWDNIYSDPYYVEIPDDFELGKTVIGEEAYFKIGCNQGYEIASTSELKNCSPCLIGGSSVEIVNLKVLEMVGDK